MESYSLRNYLEICYIIIHNQVKSKAFIDYFKLNYYKFTGDFIKLCEMAPFYGIRILLENNEIAFQVMDEGLFAEKRGKCISFFHRNKTRKNSNISLVGVIGEMILLSEEGLTIENVCELVGCSRSGIRYDLKAARDIIESFNIRIRNIPYRGLIADGNEFDIRLCLTSFFGFSEKSVVITKLLDYVVLEQFSLDLEGFVRFNISHVFANYHILMTNANIARLAQYILIQKGRVSNGKIINIFNLGKIKKEEIIKTQAYLASRSIYRRIYNGCFFGANEEIEVLSLTALILLFQDRLNRDDLAILPSVFNKDTNQLYAVITCCLKEHWNINFEFESDKLVLQDFCFKLNFKRNFGILSYRAFGTYGRQMIYEDNPLLAGILHDIRDNLEKKCNTVIRTPYLNDLTFLIIKQISTEKLEVKKPILSIFSGEGYGKAWAIQQILAKNLSYHFYQSIEIQTDGIRSRIVDENRLTLSDRSAQSEDYLVIDEVDRLLERLHQIKHLLMDKTKISVKDIHKIREDFKTTTADSILKRAHQKIQAKNFKNKLFQKRFNNTLVQIESSFLSKETFIYCGLLKNGLKFENEIVHSYLYVAISMNTISLKLLSEILRLAVKNEIILNAFLDENIEQFVNHRMKYLIEQ